MLRLLPHDSLQALLSFVLSVAARISSNILNSGGPGPFQLPAFQVQCHPRHEALPASLTLLDLIVVVELSDFQGLIFTS